MKTITHRAEKKTFIYSIDSQNRGTKPKMQLEDKQMEHTEN